MSSKSTILSAIRKTQVPAVELPNLQRDDWISYADRQQQFIDSVKAVGGVAERISDLAEVRGKLEGVSSFRSATSIFSQVPDAIRGNLDMASIDDPHDLEHIDYAVFQGEFGVAENGAIWLDNSNLKHRVVYVISQHLVIVLNAEQICDNMHQAYERLTFSVPHYGLFMSGPSKTADIEQSLVIGAHGARSLHVFLIAT